MEGPSTRESPRALPFSCTHPRDRALWGPIKEMKPQSTMRTMLELKPSATGQWQTAMLRLPALLKAVPTYGW